MCLYGLFLLVHLCNYFLLTTFQQCLYNFIINTCIPKDYNIKNSIECLNNVINFCLKFLFIVHILQSLIIII